MVPLHCANKLKTLAVLWKTMKKLQNLTSENNLYDQRNITCLMTTFTNNVTIKSKYLLEILSLETSEGIQKGSAAVSTDFKISQKPLSHNKRQFTASLVLNISDAKENTFDSLITYTFFKR